MSKQMSSKKKALPEVELKRSTVVLLPEESLRRIVEDYLADNAERLRLPHFDSISVDWINHHADDGEVSLDRAEVTFDHLEIVDV